MGGGEGVSGKGVNDRKKGVSNRKIKTDMHVTGFVVCTPQIDICTPYFNATPCLRQPNSPQLARSRGLNTVPVGVRCRLTAQA